MDKHAVIPSSATEHPLISSAPGKRRRWLIVSGIYIALSCATWFSALVADVFDLKIVSLWYPPAGLRFFLLLAFGWAGALLDLVTQVVLLEGLLPLLDLSPVMPFQPLRALWMGVSLLSAYAAFTFPLRRWAPDIRDFASARYSALFFVAALGASALAALAGTLLWVYEGLLQPGQEWAIFRSWLVGDLIGVITIAPLLLVLLLPSLDHYLQPVQWRRSPWRAVAGQERSGRQDLADCLLLVLVLLGIFGVPWSLGLNRYFPFAALFLLLPPAIPALFIYACFLIRPLVIIKQSNNKDKKHP